MALFAKYVKNKFSVPLFQCKMRIKNPLHVIVNTVETLGLGVFSVSECKLNSADADPYFHEHNGASSNSLVGFAFLFKPEELVIANGPGNMVL